jgi:hypothetical protein
MARGQTSIGRSELSSCKRRIALLPHAGLMIRMAPRLESDEGSWQIFYARPMAYDSRKGLLLNVLLRGLADAVRRNDLPAAERYCQRLRLSAEQLAADELVQNAVEKLLSGSRLWIEAAEADRNEARQQMLEVIDRVISLLKS